MLFHSMYRFYGGYTKEYIADLLYEPIPAMRKAISPNYDLTKKDGIWLGLEDIEKLTLSRIVIEHYDIKSSIDQWEQYNV